MATFPLVLLLISSLREIFAQKAQIDIYSPCPPAVAFDVPRPQSQSSDNETQTFRLGYRPELDGIRGLSILFVLGLHVTPRLVPGGYFGVEVFFVLSGFLITSLLLQEWSRTGSISLKKFYFRRALRLGPALIVYLLLLGTYAFLFLTREKAAEIYSGILWTLSYVSNWVIALQPSYPISIMAITWSLAVEEQFYIVWPPILSVLLRNNVRRRWILLIIVLGIVAVVVRRHWLWKSGASFHRLYYATDTRADGLLLGCLAGCLVSWDLIPKSRLASIAFKGLALVSTALVGYFVFTIKSSNSIIFRGVFSAASIAIALSLLVLVVWAETFAAWILRFPPLTWIGRISYGLYLWHWPVRGLIFSSTQEPSTRQIIIALGLSFAITAVSFYLIEQPFLKWKQRLSRA